MNYNSIDLILANWASRNDVTILKEDRHNERRYFYISSQAGDTFQIVIEPERDCYTRIDTHLIETFTESEVHYTVEVPISELYEVLDKIRKLTEVWFGDSARSPRQGLTDD